MCVERCNVVTFIIYPNCLLCWEAFLLNYTYALSILVVIWWNFLFGRLSVLYGQFALFLLLHWWLFRGSGLFYPQGGGSFFFRLLGGELVSCLLSRSFGQEGFHFNFVLSGDSTFGSFSEVLDAFTLGSEAVFGFWLLRFLLVWVLALEWLLSWSVWVMFLLWLPSVYLF